MIALRRIARRHTPTGLWVCVVLGFAAAAVAQTELSDGVRVTRSVANLARVGSPFLRLILVCAGGKARGC